MWDRETASKDSGSSSWNKKQGQTVYKTKTEIQTDIETKMHWDKYASRPIANQTHRLKQSPKRRQTNIHKEVLNAKNVIWKKCHK